MVALFLQFPNLLLQRCPVRDERATDGSKLDGATAYALLQASSYFASRVEPEIHRDLNETQRFDQLSKYREKRMIQVGHLMAKLEKNSRKFQARKQLRNREWEELLNLNS